MALVKCKECGHEISKNAEMCPHCGKKIKKGNLFLRLVGILFIIGLIGNLTDGDKKQPSNSNNQSSSRRIAYEETNKITTKKYDNIQKEELMKKISPDIVKYIDDIVIKIDKYGYEATVNINYNFAYSAETIGYRVVQEILNMLVSRGLSPYKDSIPVYVHMHAKVKGATGQDMFRYYGMAYYDYNHDTIKWDSK